MESFYYSTVIAKKGEKNILMQLNKFGQNQATIQKNIGKLFDINYIC